ncbi:hypothetical protein ACF0H5_015856 [Mactra antiquata]
MVDVYINIVYSITCLLVLISLSTASESIQIHDKQADVIHHLDAVTSHLNALSRTIRSAHSDITAKQYEECAIMGTMSDSVCDLLFMDKTLGESETVDKVIHNTLSPGKRSQETYNDMMQRKTLVGDLLQKRRLLENLNAIIEDATNSITTERKRSCNLNLGFHCQTEQYAAIADMYNWLQSSLSPGRKRRDVNRNTKMQSDDSN